MFWLAIFAIDKLYPPSSLIRSAIHKAMTHLIFVGKVGQLGGGMWLWGVDQLVSYVFYNKKSIRQHFILPFTTSKTWYSHYWHWPWFFQQMTKVEFANDIVQLFNIEDKRIRPITYDWEVENLWFRSLEQHLPQLWFQWFQVLWSRFKFANTLKLLLLESIAWMIPRNWRCPH